MTTPGLTASSIHDVASLYTTVDDLWSGLLATEDTDDRGEIASRFELAMANLGEAREKLARVSGPIVRAARHSGLTIEAIATAMGEPEETITKLLRDFA